MSNCVYSEFYGSNSSTQVPSTKTLTSVFRYSISPRLQLLLFESHLKMTVPVPCLARDREGRHSMCCMHIVNTFFCLLFYKEGTISTRLISSIRLRTMEQPLQPCNCVLWARHHRDRDKGLLKEMFPGRYHALQSCSTVIIHSADSKHRNTAFLPITHNSTDIQC